MAVRIDRRDVGAVTVLDVKGKIVSDAVAELASVLDDLVVGGRTQLLLNLGEVSFIDSGALGTLVAQRGAVRNQGGSLKLLNPTKRISDLLVTTKLETVFDTFESEAEAVKSYES